VTVVLYVTGWCRSGSTVLGNLLNELDGVVHIGEAHYLWRNGVLGAGTNTLCGCGSQVRECPLWKGVLGRLVPPGDAATGYAQAALAGQRAYLRTRHTGARLRESLGRRERPAAAAEAVDRMVAVHRAVAAESGASVVVDSSKYPAEPAALCGRADVDLRVLHLVRDPRATAHSWRKAKAYIPAMSVTRSGAYWTGANIASERIGRAFPDRYLRLRYEDFAADPRGGLAEVLSFVGRADEPPVAADGSAVLGTNHTVTGNPDRLARGPVRIRPDESWRRDLPAVPAWVATALAAPALRHYGYAWTR
jgi:sulfotransferase family protein